MAKSNKPGAKPPQATDPRAVTLSAIIRDDVAAITSARGSVTSHVLALYEHAAAFGTANGVTDHATGNELLSSACKLASNSEEGAKALRLQASKCVNAMVAGTKAFERVVSLANKLMGNPANEKKLSLVKAVEVGLGSKAKKRAPVATFEALCELAKKGAETAAAAVKLSVDDLTAMVASLAATYSGTDKVIAAIASMKLLAATDRDPKSLTVDELLNMPAAQRAKAMALLT